MSGNDSLAEKSPSETEVRKEENKIRFEEINLPPDDGVETCMAYLDREGRESRLRDRDFHKSQTSGPSVPNDYEDSEVSCVQSKVSITKHFDSSSQSSVDTSLGLLSEISLPHSPPPTVSPYKSSSPYHGSCVNESDTSPSKTQKFRCKSPSVPGENNENSLFIPHSEIKNSPNHESSLNFHEFINSVVMPSPYDIPLPSQKPPPLPAYESKIPTSRFSPAKKKTEEDSLKNSASNYLDGNECNLESNAMNLDCDSFETIKPSLEKTTDALSSNKHHSPVLETSDGSSNMDLIEKKKIDDSRYSPSRLDSDEESPEFTAIKPKVLGKEQAKKRLMAFSLSKQPSTPLVKKENKLATVNKVGKEKPPISNKNASIQEQFRATISAIEEEKKKMMKNLPDYLFRYRNNLSKVGDTVIPNTNQNPDKTKDENDPNFQAKSVDSDEKEGNRNKYGNSSPSRSKNSRQRRSRSSSRDRRSIKERDEKKDNEMQLKKMESLHDWKTFIESGFELDSDFRRLKFRFEEKQRRKDRRRSRSPEEKADYKPIFNYLKQSSKLMIALQAKTSKPGVNATVPFQEKTVKYTRTKPMLTWAENPGCATDFYMPKQMLLENCDKSISPILHEIMEPRGEPLPEAGKTRKKYWYPQFDYLIDLDSLEKNDASNDREGEEISAVFVNETSKTEDEEKGTNKEKSSKTKKKLVVSERTKSTKSEFAKCGSQMDENDENVSRFEHKDKRLDLVSDDYLSDNGNYKFPVREMIIGDVKVRVDKSLKNVKVRSRWDSDFEGEPGKDVWLDRERADEMDIAPLEDFTDDKPKMYEERGFSVIETNKPLNNIQKSHNSTDTKLEQTNFQVNLPVTIQEPQYSNSVLDEHKGNLASEYEEFMKMVSFGASNENQVKSNAFEVDNLKSDPTDSEKNKKVDLTDWEHESDDEVKLPSKKMPYVKDDSPDSFSLLLSSYDAKKPESPERKKSGKTKSTNNVKKTNKNRKKSYREESSTDSSSDSSDSDSDSDSDSGSDSDSDSSDSEVEKRKRKKRKQKKVKKKYSTSSDSDSESNSMSLKSKKGKLKKKKSKVKKGVNACDDSNDESRSVKLKQLDFKKQQIIKKIEEIDSISVKGFRKKGKHLMGSQDDSSKSSYTDLPSKKKRKSEQKSPGKLDKSKLTERRDKNAKKSEIFRSKNDSVSDSDHVEDTKRRKKIKKKLKKRKSSNDYSSDDEGKENRKGKYGKNPKGGKKKKEGYFSSSESDSDSDSEKMRRKIKKKKKRKKNDAVGKLTESSQKMRDWNDHLLSDGPDFMVENALMDKTDGGLTWMNEKIQWERGSKTVTVEKERKDHKDLGDWEESSSDESPEEKPSDSSWDEDFPKSEMNLLSKDENLTDTAPRSKEVKLIEKDLISEDKFLNDFNLESKHESILKQNVLSKLHSQELCSSVSPLKNSTSIQLFSSLGKENRTAKSPDDQYKRHFHGIGSDFNRENKKPSKDEIYSPGHTDSEMSEAEEEKNHQNKNDNRFNRSKEDIYDPLDTNSDASLEGIKVEVSSIPLPDSDIPEIKKDIEDESVKVSDRHKPDFIALPPASESKVTASGKPPLSEKKHMISVKLQQKFQSKVASVFQSNSEDEEASERVKKGGTLALGGTAIKPKTVEDIDNSKGIEDSKSEEGDLEKLEVKKKTDDRSRERSRDRSRDRDQRLRDHEERQASPRSRSPDLKTENEEFRSKADSSVKISSEDSGKDRESEVRTPQCKPEPISDDKTDEVTDIVRPIPVLTGLDVRIPEGHSWGRSHIVGSEDMAYNCDHLDLMDPSQMDYYGSQEGKGEALYDMTDKKYGVGRYDRDYEPRLEGADMLMDNRVRKDKRKSRSRSSSPKRRRRSKTPERRRSPRHRSVSPRRRGRSPFSPRRRVSPRRKSPNRRYRSSRSPERKGSRSPRKRRQSPSRRSRSPSPRKHKLRLTSPRRRSMSPRKSLSPRKDSGYPIGVRNLIHVIGATNDDMDMSPLTQTPKYDSPMGFTRSLADSTISDSELSNTFYSREYPGEYGGHNYPEEVTINNLITLQNHDADKRTDSPKRLTLDQRIEIELGVPPPGQSEQYHPQSYQQFPEVHSNQYQNSYPCDNACTTNGNQNFYPNQTTDFNGQFFNGQQPPPNFGQFHQYPRHNPPGMRNSVLQVGNIMEVVPAMQVPPPPLPHPKGHQIMQVGNVLQVVPSPKSGQGAPHGFGVPPATPEGSVMVPQNNVPTPEAIINPLIKAIQLEREKRKKEKEKRRAEREARRKARQLRREAKLMSVNEKLKESVQDEGLMLGQEVEEDELLEEIEHPSPPVPVEIVTDSSHNILPPAGKGILITAGFIPKPASEKKEVKFADGICPGEGTSTSGGEDRASPPPKPKLPKEKRYKKKKTKQKKKVKVKVHIIRQVIQADEDEDDDDLSPPPPPPGDPPPVFFARFPFGSKAQYPVYQTQTTTTTLTTVQFPTESYQ